MTITLTWPDGSTTTGRSWPDVEAAIRAEQWHTFRTRRGFRREMYRRARLWNGTTVPPAPRTSKQFIQSLADAGLFNLKTTTQGDHQS